MVRRFLGCVAVAIGSAALAVPTRADAGEITGPVTVHVHNGDGGGAITVTRNGGTQTVLVPATQPGPATQPSVEQVNIGKNTVSVDTITTQPAGPTTAPAVPPVGPTTAPAEANATTISPAAKALIDQTASAYSKLKSLELAGVLKIDVDGGGDQEKHSIDFTAAMSGRQHFRHEGKDDAIAGGNEKMQYVLFKSQGNEYLSGPAAAAGDDVDDLMEPLPGYFRHADPSLLLSLSDHPSSMLLEDVTGASQEADTKLDSQSYPTLKLVDSDHSVKTILLDPTTHLIRQVQTDLKPVLLAQSQPVDHALITVDYTTTTPNAQLKPDAFDWTPPEGALQAADPVAPVRALVGKAAPDFSLTYLDSKPVSLSDFKGKVVVLDFWATWCAPCREAMPPLEALYQSKKADGLKVLAVDVGEDASDVKEFVDKTKLGVPIVLDPDKKAVAAYSIDPIPVKVVIGKDGIVAAVLSSIGPSVDHKLQKAVDVAMAK